MAPKRPAAAAAAASGSASEASDAEADVGHQPSSPSPSKTPPTNPNPKSAAAGPASAAEDSTAAGSDSEAAYDSDADHRPAHRKAAVAASPSRKPRSPRPRSRSPDAASYSDGAASDADADPAARDGADSADDGNASPLALPRLSRAEAAAIKPLSSRPMDPPRRSMVHSFSELRSKRPRSAAVPSSVEQLKRPTRLWSLRDEIVILRGLVTYRAKRGVLPGAMYDISMFQGHIQSELSVNVTPTQLSDKVRRLKQKYNQLASRGKNGRDPDLPTQHEQSVYEIGKKVWGTSTGGDGYEIGGDSQEEHEIGESDEDVESGWDERARKNRRLMPITMANGHGSGFGAGRGKFDVEKGKDAYPYLWETVEDLSKEHPNGVAFKKAFELIEGARARGMEEKLRKFRLTEIRHQLRRMELMKETVKMVLDALEG
jgi:hypothetical protein